MKPLPTIPEVMTALECCDALRLSGKDRLRQLADPQEVGLKAFRIGKELRFTREDFLALVAKLKKECAA